MDHDQDPLTILAVKMDMQGQRCNDIHRRIDADLRSFRDDLHELRTIMHGEHGDNGLKSMLGRQSEVVKNLVSVTSEMRHKMESFDGRLWRVVVAVAVLASAVGGGVGQVINLLFK